MTSISLSACSSLTTAGHTPLPDQVPYVPAEDEEEGEFYYDEDEVVAGADGASRAALLDHFDSLLQMPQSADVTEVVHCFACCMLLCTDV